ncbi:hypothetical protein Emed_006919 [Eimeria media]
MVTCAGRRLGVWRPRRMTAAAAPARRPSPARQGVKACVLPPLTAAETLCSGWSRKNQRALLAWQRPSLSDTGISDRSQLPVIAYVRRRLRRRRPKHLTAHNNSGGDGTARGSACAAMASKLYSSSSCKFYASSPDCTAASKE